ncbi:MAG: hypothetical protein AAGH15_11800 [Myxococcota bacterium]
MLVGDSDGGETDAGLDDFGLDGGPPDGDVPDSGDPDLGGGDAGLDLGPIQTATPVLERTEPESPGNTGFPVVVGTSEAGATVSLYANGTCSGEPAATFDSSGAFEEAVAVAANTPTNLSANAIRPGASVSECSNVLRYLWDATAPSRPVIVGTEPESPAPDAVVLVTGRADPGSRVEIYLDGVCGEVALEVVADDTGTFSADIEVSFGETSISAKAIDEVGNVSACSMPFVHERVLIVEPVFPPITGITSLETITVRARVEVDASERVIFESPAGRRAAAYDAARDEWRATIPLAKGAQTLEASIAGVSGGASTPIVDVTQAVIPGTLEHVAWDPTTMDILATDGTRVLEIDPASGVAELRVDVSTLMTTLGSVAVDGMTTYMAGANATRNLIIASWDGTTLTEVANIVSSGFGAIDPEYLAVRNGGDELLVWRTNEGVTVIDIAAGTARTLVSGFRRCFAYDPIMDRGIACTNTGTPIFDVVDVDTGSSIGSRPFTGTPPTNINELRWDANGDRMVAADFTGGLFAMDVMAATSARLGSVANIEQFGVRGDTGGIVLTLRFGDDLASLRTLDPATGAIGVITLGQVGSGVELGPPTAVAVESGRLFVADGPRLLQIDLDAMPGNRRVRVSGSGSTAWSSVAFEPGTNRFFVYSEDGSLREARLSGSTSLISPAVATGFIFSDVSILPPAGMMAGELLEVNSSRTSVLARQLSNVSMVRNAETLEPDGGFGVPAPYAVAYDASNDEIGVLVREAGPTRFRIVAVPAAGGDAREIIEFTGIVGAGAFVARDIEWANDRWYVGDGPDLVAVDTRRGEERIRREFPGNILQLTAPDDDDIAFAAMQDAAGVAVWDGATGDWVVIAR